MQHPIFQYFQAIPDFPKQGILFQDISPVLRSHLKETIEALANLHTQQYWNNIDYLVGIEARGFILAAALATYLDKGFIAARKPNKLPQVAGSYSYDLEYGTATLEMQAAPSNENVVLVDDVLATGGTLNACYALSKQVGYTVIGALVVLDICLTDRNDLPTPCSALITL